MNPLQAIQKEKEEKEKLYLPKEIDLAINLIHAFIKNVGSRKTNTLGLKLALILSGARPKIKYDKNNRVAFSVDELCTLCNISRKELSKQIKSVIEVSYHFIDINGDRVGTTPIHTYRYTTDCKNIYISVSDEARRLFTDLGKGGYQFTQGVSKNLMHLKHKHSLRMQLFLEMINNYSDKKAKRIKMNLAELNGYFGVKYSNFYEIERKILKPVKEEIDLNNKLTFDYKFADEKQGNGRPKITDVVIDVIDNSQNLFAQ